MSVRPSIVIIIGALLTAIVAFLGAGWNGYALVEKLETDATAVIAKNGGGDVSARFTTANGWPSRHVELSGGENLDDGVRARVAQAVGNISGIGGVYWADGTANAETGQVPISPMHCQDDVQALLRARSIRFEESSSAIQLGSRELLDEVATALRPCLGSIIAVVGHTDSSGPEAGNRALSKERAAAVKSALVRRGIPRDGMRSSGVGSGNPVEGLDPTDPANRRIEFSVIATMPLEPTPVDTPGPR